MVIALVGEKSRSISRFLECCNNSFLLINGIEVMSRNRRHQHRYAFVRGVRLGQHVAKGCQPLYFGKFRVRFTIITIKRPVGGTGRFSNYHDVDFPILSRMNGFCLISEIFRGLCIVLCLCGTLKGQCNVIAHIGRI